VNVLSTCGRVARGAGLAAAIALLAPSAVGGSDTAPAGGKAIYDAKCSQCHGASGKGDGPASALLSPRPTDFSTARYKIRTTASGSLPTDEDLARTITEGLHGTAMPAWKGLWSDGELRDVIAYIKSFSPRFETEQPRPIARGHDVPSSPSSVAAGRLVFDRLGCAACHGSDGAGTDAIATSLEDAAGRHTVATNLTEPWTFRGGATARDVYLRVVTGMNGTPMPAFVDTASDEDLWHLANYVVSLARKPSWQMTAAELAEHDARVAARAAEHPLERGRYLVATLRCALCHTPLRPDGSLVESMLFAGGQRHRWDSLGEFVSNNLTSDEATGLGSWTDDQIKAALTRGMRPDGSRLLPYAMPWPHFALLKPEDLNAIVAFLRTLPAISNEIPPPRRPNIAAYLWGKLKVRILGQDQPEYLYAGNAGSATTHEAESRAGTFAGQAMSR
jgi:mono/diheme cytochrome c family protein